MTLLEYAMKLDQTGKVITKDSKGNIVINTNNFPQNKYNLPQKEQEKQEILESIIEKFIWKDARYRYTTPCRLPPEVYEEQERGIFTLDLNQVKIMNTLEVIIDPSTKDIRMMARKPYFRIRGKSITNDQAVEIIRRTDWIIEYNVKSLMGADFIGSNGFENCWLCASNYQSGQFGWAHPDGTIGMNGILGYKYPDVLDLFMGALDFAIAFPFLDMIIAVTDWNEMPEYAWGSDEDDDEEDFGVENNDDKYYDFLDNIVVGIWIHDNKIELMAPDRAKAKYQEYVSLYGLADTSRYTHYYYSDHKEKLYNQVELSKQCFKLNGADPEPVFNREGNIHFIRS